MNSAEHKGGALVLLQSRLDSNIDPARYGYTLLHTYPQKTGIAAAASLGTHAAAKGKANKMDRVACQEAVQIWGTAARVQVNFLTDPLRQWDGPTSPVHFLCHDSALVAHWRLHEQGGNYAGWQLHWHVVATDGSTDRTRGVMGAGAVYYPPCTAEHDTGVPPQTC
jgi:hypothetical protein